MTGILTEIEAFTAEFGLSDHRAGILLANNGRLVERLRAGRRLWPETKAAIRKNLKAERAKRVARAPSKEAAE